MHRNRSTSSSIPRQYTLDEVRWISIGGIPQAIHVLARSPTAPVVLFVHGGPGIPSMPFVHVNATLAESFVLVSWDQRGAGKSYARTGNSSQLTLTNLVSDGCALIEYLCDTFETKAITVVGHSCGSALGVFLAAKLPGRIRNLIGVGQVSNLRDAEEDRFRMAHSLAKSRGDKSALSALRRLGPSPYRSIEHSDELERIAVSLTGDSLDPYSDDRYRGIALASDVYSRGDWSNLHRGIQYSQACLWEQLYEELDLATQVPRLDVPVSFFIGEHDALAPWTTARRFFDQLHAPLGKRFHIVKGVGHWPHLEIPWMYRAALRRVLESN